MEGNKMNYWVEKLRLEEHPEGGYYRETYRSSLQYEGRSLSTHIYYLLPGQRHSRFHRLKYDEHWYYHYGSSMKIYFLYDDGQLKEYQLGPDLEKGEELSVWVPGGTIFGGEVVDRRSFTLVSCHMSPGFHFEDFEMFSEQQLVRMFPEKTSIIQKLS